MKIIFISGPSGSGKTSLSNQIILKFKNGFILSTDNYYKTGLFSKLLSKFVEGYFDRRISFNYNLFKKDFKFILNNGYSNQQRYYEFKKQIIKNCLTETNNIKYLIVEGIFVNKFLKTLYNNDSYFLELKINKNLCKKRVIQRDLKERGKAKKQAENDFLKSWDIYYEKFKNKSIKSKNNEFLITKNTNIDKVLKKIFY